MATPPGLRTKAWRSLQRELANRHTRLHDSEWVLAGVVVLVATASAVACGGGGNGTNRLTLTDDSCAYEGDQTPSATKAFEAEVANKSSKLGAFEIAKIDPGHTVR